MKKITPAGLSAAVETAFMSYFDPKHNPNVEHMKDIEMHKSVLLPNKLLTQFILAQLLRQMELLDD